MQYLFHWSITSNNPRHFAFHLGRVHFQVAESLVYDHQTEKFTEYVSCNVAVVCVCGCRGLILVSIRKFDLSSFPRRSTTEFTKNNEHMGKDNVDVCVVESTRI